MANTEVLCMLRDEQPFPVDMFGRMFPVSVYTFPHLDKDAAGFVTHESLHRWATYNLFDVAEGVPTPVTDPALEERDLAVELIMTTTGIAQLELDLRGPPTLDRAFRTTHCYMSPPDAHKTALFDIVYEADHLFKYFFRYFVQIVFKHKYADVGAMDFIFAREPTDGVVHVTKTLRRAGFTALKNEIRLFALRHKEEVPQWTASFDEYDNQEFRAQLTFQEVGITVSPDATHLMVHDVVPRVLVGPPHESAAVELPGDHPAHVFKQFMEAHYPALKRAFPVYQRMESVFKWCAVNKFLQPESAKPCVKPVFVDCFADSIHGLGGVKMNAILAHRHVPFIMNQPRFIAKPVDPVARVHVIRRSLSALPGKAGAVAHSGLLLVTASGQRSILEYGVDVGNGKRGTALRPLGPGEELDGAWTQQQLGAAPDGSYSTDDMKTIMESHAGKGGYNMHSHNCHMAQEATRRAVGIHVDQPYKPLW